MKIRPLLISILTISLILSASASIIAYGRGYRINFKKPSQLDATGIITVTSDPVAAQVLVNGVLKTATNNSFNLVPDWYTITIRKEAYIPWEKKIRVQGELVVRADAYLFPTSPSLSPITTSGIIAPSVSPDGGKIAFLVPPEAARDGIKRPGLYTLELSDRPLGGRNRDPKLIAELASQGTSLRSCKVLPCKTILWSPDGTEIMVLEGTSATLYDTTKFPSPITPISPLFLISLEKDWENQVDTRNRQKLMAFKQGFVEVATSSARIVSFSPDETKLLYEATASATIPPLIDPPLIGSNPTEEIRTITPGNLYVYDSKEDKNYFFLAKKELSTATPSPRSPRSPQSPLSLIWFPTSKHLLLIGGGKIDVMEYDRTNWTTLYSGPFDESFVTPWPTGSRIVILTNLNPGAGNLPNLYTVNLR